MEARASFTGTSVPKTFVAIVLVVIAMGLAAMSGYMARGLNGGGAAAAQGQPVHAAPGTVLRQDNPGRAVDLQAVHPAAGTVLRQDNPARASAELPSYIPQAKAAKGTRILQDDPYFIASQTSVSTDQAASNDGLVTRKGGHQELP